MKEPLTEELLEDLLGSPDPKSFTDKNHIVNLDLPTYLQSLLDEKGLVRTNVIRKAGLNETFGYQIFMGQRKATRNKLLQLVFAMNVDLREANRILRIAGVSELYCKKRRDAIIIFCLDRGYSLHKTDEELFRFGEETICPDAN